MATKKKTRKELREAEKKGALRQRLTDMLWGAIGSDARPTLDPEEDGGLSMACGLESWLRWIAAISNEWARPDFALPAEQDGFVPPCIFDPDSLHRFDSMDEAVELLYGLGARA